MVNPPGDSYNRCSHCATAHYVSTASQLSCSVIEDLTTLKKTEKFWHLSPPPDDEAAPVPWAIMRNSKRELHLKMLYRVIRTRRIP